jgi:hypothetical protein
VKVKMSRVKVIVLKMKKIDESEEELEYDLEDKYYK